MGTAYGVLSECARHPTNSLFGLLEPTVVAMRQVVPQWAQKTLERHAADPRPLVTLAELETGSTGDELWDAMQQQLVLTGARASWLRFGSRLASAACSQPACRTPASSVDSACVRSCNAFARDARNIMMNEEYITPSQSSWHTPPQLDPSPRASVPHQAGT